MQFADAVLVRLADATTRNAVFNEAALAAIAAAGYDTDRLAIDAPYTAVFDELTFGAALADPVSANARWSSPATALLGEVAVRFEGWPGNAGQGPDALWRGAVVGRTRATSGRVSALQSALPSLGRIDDAIVAAAGALPADPAAREQARRDQFLAMLRAAAHDPAAVTPDLIDRWLHQAGVPDMAALLTRAPGLLQVAQIQLAFEVTGPDAATPTPLPIAAGIMVRDVTAPGFRLSTLLGESKRVQQQLLAIGWVAAAQPGLPQRHPSTIVWVVDEAWFDDADWPGGGAGTAAQQRARRIAAATAWLSREGIGLAALPHPAA